MKLFIIFAYERRSYSTLYACTEVVVAMFMEKNSSKYVLHNDPSVLQNHSESERLTKSNFEFSSLVSYTVPYTVPYTVQYTYY